MQCSAAQRSAASCNAMQMQRSAVRYREPRAANVGWAEDSALLGEAHAEPRDLLPGGRGCSRFPAPSRRGHCRRALPGLQRRSGGGGGWRPEQEERSLQLQPRLHPPALPVGGLHQPLACCRLFLQPFGRGKWDSVLIWGLTWSTAGAGALASVCTRQPQPCSSLQQAGLGAAPAGGKGSHCCGDSDQLKGL